MYTLRNFLHSLRKQITHFHVIQHFKMQQWELLWAPLSLYFPKKVPISRGNLSKIHRFPRLIGSF